MQNQSQAPTPVLSLTPNHEFTTAAICNTLAKWVHTICLHSKDPTTDLLQLLSDLVESSALFLNTKGADSIERLSPVAFYCPYSVASNTPTLVSTVEKLPPRPAYAGSLDILIALSDRYSVYWVVLSNPSLTDVLRLRIYIEPGTQLSFPARLYIPMPLNPSLSTTSPDDTLLAPENPSNLWIWPSPREKPKLDPSSHYCQQVDLSALQPSCLQHVLLQQLLAPNELAFLAKVPLQVNVRLEAPSAAPSLDNPQDLSLAWEICLRAPSSLKMQALCLTGTNPFSPAAADTLWTTLRDALVQTYLHYARIQRLRCIVDQVDPTTRPDSYVRVLSDLISAEWDRVDLNNLTIRYRNTDIPTERFQPDTPFQPTDTPCAHLAKVCNVFAKVQKYLIGRAAAQLTC